MQLQRYVDALKADLTAVAELGDDATAEAASRLVVTLQASVGLRLLDALSEAALELTDKLPSGHVEVRLAGQDPELVFVGDEPEEAVAAPDDGQTARISLRLPESLKTAVESAAAREGVSVNTWIVRALTRSTTSGTSVQSGNRLQGWARS
ncbi:MAG: toxin-antitoxin system HicB family antitoxin [Gaiellaceae bacterium]